MKKILRINESDIKRLIKKIILQEKINEISVNGYENISAGTAKLNGDEVIVILNDKNSIIAVGPETKYVGNDEETICKIAEQLIDDLFINESNMLNELNYKYYDIKRVKCKNISESKKKKNPCWKGYKPIGTKIKNGKEVPNCIPINEDSNQYINYMFFQNLNTIKHAIEDILNMDKDVIDEIITNGHNWILDHISTATDDIEEVYHFLDSNINNKDINKHNII